VRTRLTLKGGTPEDRHQDKLGVYVLCDGELINDRVCYQQLGNPSRMIWFLTPYWYVGKRDEKALGQGWLQVRSLAHVPEQISSPWSVWHSSSKKWVEAPDLAIYPEEADTADESATKGDAPALAVPKALPMDREVGMESPMVDERDGLGTAVLAMSGAGRPDHYDVYITHDWGQDGAGRRGKERVAKLSEFLRARGLAVWCDTDSVEGDVVDKICGVIDDSELVLVCISQTYLDKVGGKNGALDTCKKEFEYAERTKGTDKLLAVVTDPSTRSPREWRGGVGMVLGSRPFKDLSVDESDPAFESTLHALYEELVALKGGASPSFAQRPPPPPPPPPPPERRDSGGQRAQAAAAASPGSPAPKAGLQEMTMAQKVARIKEELSLENSLHIAKAVAEANSMMGIEPQGPLAKQVETLLTELGVIS